MTLSVLVTDSQRVTWTAFAILQAKWVPFCLTILSPVSPNLLLQVSQLWNNWECSWLQQHFAFQIRLTRLCIRCCGEWKNNFCRYNYIFRDKNIWLLTCHDQSRKFLQQWKIIFGLAPCLKIVECCWLARSWRLFLEHCRWWRGCRRRWWWWEVAGDSVQANVEDVGDGGESVGEEDEPCLSTLSELLVFEAGDFAIHTAIHIVGTQQSASDYLVFKRRGVGYCSENSPEPWLCSCCAERDLKSVKTLLTTERHNPDSVNHRAGAQVVYNGEARSRLWPLQNANNLQHTIAAWQQLSQDIQRDCIHH